MELRVRVSEHLECYERMMNVLDELRCYKNWWLYPELRAMPEAERNAEIERLEDLLEELAH